MAANERLLSKIKKGDAAYMNCMSRIDAGCSRLRLCAAEARYCPLPQYDPVFRGFGGLFFGGIISSFMWLGIIEIVTRLL
jgi:hypothetical protein